MGPKNWSKTQILDMCLRNRESERVREKRERALTERKLDCFLVSIACLLSAVCFLSTAFYCPRARVRENGIDCLIS